WRRPLHDVPAVAVRFGASLAPVVGETDGFAGVRHRRRCAIGERERGAAQLDDARVRGLGGGRREQEGAGDEGQNAQERHGGRSMANNRIAHMALDVTRIPYRPTPTKNAWVKRTTTAAR